ncbi:MAG: phosphate ABC transporter permease subunit PstC [candidate division KSB1 bacterium]|nr:phosphate ABC transporter permease subunit PstC [candidate division KSB1 bacterium]MDZ7336212.1 phosphate ABC transporter permease subunit PstC [candidate division KSB1 bacterium]MDZ7358955.1 phosphate ABC transporter permease subunit PstC [candidate division KSB1 bacterium]MDZ7376363.1 phosphate ABC transporter permease subunit PstC [candidate division KSB1 bacterium]MDZ7402346.1 phosphate ABC transporter permease subunit PstC [candidate division KSB1 bacterium]
MQWRRLKDAFATNSFRIILSLTNSIIFIIAIGLFIKGKPILFQKSISELLVSSIWQPLKGHFGFLPFIIGTIAVTAFAMTLAVPICLLSAIYLAEYAPRRLRELLRPVIDVLAGIPSVIYGLWGVIVIVPLVRWLGQVTGHITSGYNLLSGAIVLAIMVFPFIISVATEVFLTVPIEAHEASLSLGATRWETVKHVVLKAARRGVMAAIVLGFARAIGETMAVLMVVGNVAKVPKSLFDPAYPLPALIANNYGEMMSIPLYDAALMLAALILLVIVTIFNLGAHFTLLRMERKSQ